MGEESVPVISICPIIVYLKMHLQPKVILFGQSGDCSTAKQLSEVDHYAAFYSVLTKELGRHERKLIGKRHLRLGGQYSLDILFITILSSLTSRIK